MKQFILHHALNTLYQNGSRLDLVKIEPPTSLQVKVTTRRVHTTASDPASDAYFGADLDCTEAGRRIKYSSGQFDAILVICMSSRTAELTHPGGQDGRYTTNGRAPGLFR